MNATFFEPFTTHTLRKQLQLQSQMKIAGVQTNRTNGRGREREKKYVRVTKIAKETHMLENKNEN